MINYPMLPKCQIRWRKCDITIWLGVTGGELDYSKWGWAAAGFKNSEVMNSRVKVSLPFKTQDDAEKAARKWISNKAATGTIDLRKAIS